MKSIIEEIFYGKRGNCEVIEESEGYWEAHKEYGKIYEELEKGLNEEQKKILDNLFLASGGLEGEAALTYYKEGFKLGMLIAVETLT